MTIEQAVERIQFAYPQVYFACHTRHGRRRSSAHHVSASDIQVLVHVDVDAPVTISELAGHLDLAVSTLSETVTRLQGLGYVEKQAGAAGDRRRVGLRLTRRGVEAVRASSVLDAARLRRVLRRLPAPERHRAVRGLDELARACRRAPKGARNRSRA